jgi:hypothetical protein
VDDEGRHNLIKKKNGGDKGTLLKERQDKKRLKKLRQKEKKLQASKPQEA